MANDKDEQPINVMGGAVVVEAQNVPNRPEPVDGEPMIDVRTTARGTFGNAGIVPVGTRAEVPASRVSDEWMEPATKASETKLKRWRDKNEDEVEADEAEAAAAALAEAAKKAEADKKAAR